MTKDKDKKTKMKMKYKKTKNKKGLNSLAFKLTLKLNQ